MEYDIKELEKELDIVKNKLNALIEENNGDFEKAYHQSVEVDKVVAKYIKAQIELNEERGNIMEKYKELLDTPFRFEITAQIRTEVRKDCPNVGVKELEHFSNNIYVYCCLLANNIEEQEIVEQLLYLNNKFFEEMQKEEFAIPNEKSKITNTLEYLTHLKEKYKKIIKERI